MYETAMPILCNVYNRLFLIDEDSFGTIKIAFFVVYLEEFQKLKDGFTVFQLKHVSRTQNSKIDSFAHGAKKSVCLFCLYRYRVYDLVSIVLTEFVYVAHRKKKISVLHFTRRFYPHNSTEKRLKHI